MGRNSPESMARKRSVTCNLCRQRKPIDCDGVYCPHCAAYTAWRKTEMPDEREWLILTPAEAAERERRILTYQVRAEFLLPLFEDDGKESAA